MARSTVREDVIADVADYTHAVIAYADETGHPVNVAANFRTDTERGVIVLDAPQIPGSPGVGSEVNVIFSHIRPYPGVGYDQRRYVSVWGTVSAANGTLEVKPSRTHGWDEERMSFFELCERSVPSAHEYMRKLSAERGEEVKPTMSLGWLFFLATRVPFLTATFVPVFLGAVIARFHGHSAWWVMLLALLGASAIHLGLNVANDVSDATSGADEANVNPTMFSGGSRVIQYGLVSLKAMKMTSLICYAIGIAIGIYLTVVAGPQLLWIGAAGLFLSFFYTAPPFKLVHRGLGEICVALGFGPIMVLGTYYAVRGASAGDGGLSFEAFYASLPVALLIMLVLYVNQIPDRPADERAGKRTIVVRLPQRSIVTGYAVSVAATYLLIAVGAVTGIMPIWTLLGLATIPLALQVYKGISSHYESPYELMGAMGKNIQLHLFTGLALIVGYVVAILV
ncbi:MAG: 1,4-dihydroxy-2-naphthoate polyprenyltransferase [Actinomycetota bacterium]|jgi:1,4-dihydroxy-2-naphthoate octaprenyltransferase|nr:1,4-dihydroxy-2-naphthoate polyprenyltransferase [Actinomycetota bacterium]